MNNFLVNKLPYIGILAAVSLSAAGCANPNGGKRLTKLDSQDHIEKIQKTQKDQNILIDKDQISSASLASRPNEHSDQGNMAVTLSLDDAMQRAASQNKDVLVAALDVLIAQDNVTLAQFRALPNVKATGTFTRRSNLSASSSQSIETGSQSLEPSTSSERSRRLYDMEAQWNLVDAVIAYIDGQSQKDQTLIAKERLRKVQHNLERDILASYWRSLSEQQMRPLITMLDNGQTQFLDAIETASNEFLLPIERTSQKQDQLNSRAQKLNTLTQEVKLAAIELKSLTNIPLTTNIHLNTQIGGPTDHLRHENPATELSKLKSLPLERLELIALTNRPEIREAFLNENIAVQSTRQELLRTIPVLNLIYTKSYDSNKFLRRSNWLNYSAALSQSLTDLLTLPERYKQAQNQEEQAKMRRDSLAAAIMAQVHIARIRQDIAKREFDRADRQAKQLKRKAKYVAAKNSYDTVADFDQWLSDADLVAATIERHIAYADYQRSIADFMSTLGLSIHQDHYLLAAQANMDWEKVYAHSHQKEEEDRK